MPRHERIHMPIVLRMAMILVATSVSVPSGSTETARPGPIYKPPLRVVFSGLSQGGTWDLWSASSDGTRLEQFTSTPDLDERTPVLSPDRKWVAYSTSRGDLRLYDTYDRRLKTLTLPSNGRPAWPAWGPDARNLYYVNVEMGKGPDEAQVWRYDVESGNAEKIADEPEVEGWPGVSPEGILLFTTWTQSQHCHLSTMTLPKSAPKRLWDSSLTLSGATQLSNGRVAVVAGDGVRQKVILLSREGKLEREYVIPGASGRPVAYQNDLLLTRIDGGLAMIHVVNLSTGSTRPWMSSVPKGLMQMRDPDYK